MNPFSVGMLSVIAVETAGWVTEGSGWEQCGLGKGTWHLYLQECEDGYPTWLPLELTLGDGERSLGDWSQCLLLVDPSLLGQHGS